MHAIPLLFAAALLVSCNGDSAEPLFREATDTGVKFTHTVDLTGTFALPEIMGSGCAVFDANGDNLPDLYFTDAGRCPRPGAANRLFLRNADGTYADATAQSGLGDTGYGMGVAVGDIDNDGDLDVFVGNDGRDALFENDGKGIFANITERAGITVREWTTSVAFLDYDADGFLDLFVVNYVRFDPKNQCTNRIGRPAYCSPKVFPGVRDRLYRNRGNGTFEDVTEKAGITGEGRNGLGVIVDDFDDDGWPDVFVANDGEANHLWMNNHDGTFREEGLVMGVAVNAHGAAEASMGVAAGDIDADGDLDLFMTHLKNESNTLYLREKGGFVDGSMRSGLALPSFACTGFGTALFDIDHDGDLDLAIANGRVEQTEPDPRATIDPLWNRFAEPNQLFLGDGHGKFVDVSATAGPFCEPLEVTRGLATADLDGDGDLDMVVSNCKGPARIYENIAAKSGHWLRVRAIDKTMRRDVFGAVIRIHAGGVIRRRTISPQNSYLTSSEIPAHFGLGPATTIDRIEVTWPGGKKETFPGGGVDRTVTLTRGEGKS